MEKGKTEKKELSINVFFNEAGISILEILEVDFKESADKYLKIHSRNH